MPRILRLAVGDGTPAIEVTLQKITPGDIYGRKTLEKRNDAGGLLSHAFVTPDGAHFLTAGSTSSVYVDPDGKLVPDVVPTDEDGKVLPIVPDMFKGEVPLNQVITVEDYFTYNMNKTYMLESQADLAPLLDLCNKVLADRKFLAFTYAYYPTAFPETAILIPVKGRIAVVVGSAEPLRWAKLNTNLAEIFAEADEEEEEDVEFGEFW